MYIWSDANIKVTNAEGITYRPELKPFLLNGSKSLGAVIVCPGGAYHHFGKLEMDLIALKLNALGFHAFVLTYRVNPATYPAPQKDALRAIKIVRANAEKWNINPNQIAVCGFSAGGHLAGSCGILFDRLEVKNHDESDKVSARPDAIILGYPVINICAPFANLYSGDMLFGSPEITPERQKMNLEEQIRPDMPPVFIWGSADDEAVNIKNSILFFQNCQYQKITSALHIFPHCPHGLGLSEAYPDVKIWPKLAADFLTSQCGFDAL